MIIVIMGPQGCGKSTQADLLAKKLNIPHISTGDIFRDLEESKTPLGKRVWEALSKGKLVSDEDTMTVVSEALKDDAYAKGFIIDGFPRNLYQAQHAPFIPDFALYINVSDKTSFDRLLNRKREDDNPEIIRERLREYHANTELVLDFYRVKSILIEVNGEGTIKAIHNLILRKLSGIKTKEDLDKMRESCAIASKVMEDALGYIRLGITTCEVDKFIERKIKSYGGKPSFRGQDGYKFASCISINDEVVHGLPSSRTINKGDVVSIDLGVLFRGFHSDMCCSVEVGGEKEKKFLDVGRKALDAAIGECRPGNCVGDISNAMQRVVEGAGYSVVKDLVGHGIGRKLHEEPQIPCFGKRGTGPSLKEGMVIAIEVMYMKGRSDLVLLPDSWTFSTRDGKLSAMFEHTVAIVKGGYEVLTKF